MTKTTKLSGFFKTAEQFLLSKTLMHSLLVAACIITIFRLETLGLLLFSSVIMLSLVFCKDLIATTFPFLLTCLMVIKCYDSFDRFVKLAWLVIPFIIVIVFHFTHYKKPLRIGKSFWGLLAVSVAVILGGAGKITASEYFSPVSLFNVFGLGLGMLLAYLLMKSQFSYSDAYDFHERFSYILSMVGLFGCFMVLSYYVENYELVLNTGKVLNFQWRNNVSTFLMIMMPFPFYLSTKKHAWIWGGILSYACILLAGSRGGTLFGSIEFMLCMAFVLGCDEKKRKHNLIIVGSLIVIVFAFFEPLRDFFSITIHKIMESDQDVRVHLYKRAIEDYLSSPIFGQGIGYFGNNDLWEPKKFALNWYNSLPLQILGSLGTVGFLAYGVQWFIRAKILFVNFNPFKQTLLISYLGIFMMSLVNPGEFVPIPYGFIVVLLFVVAEMNSESENHSRSNDTKPKKLHSAGS